MKKNANIAATMGCRRPVGGEVGDDSVFDVGSAVWMTVLNRILGKSQILYLVQHYTLDNALLCSLYLYSGQPIAALLTG